VREEKGSGCEGGNVFDLFAVVLRQRLRREVMSAKQSNGKKKSAIKAMMGLVRNCIVVTSLWLVADACSDVDFPLRSEGGSDAFLTVPSSSDKK
jgi:hypothetical protein